MRFLDAHWAKNHVLSVSRKLMDWQYYNNRWVRYNFLIGVDNTSGEILGVLGYIPTYLYDMAICDSDKHVWLTIWKVRNDVSKTTLGLQLMNAVFLAEGTKNISTVGINQDVEPLYRMMKFETGTLEHYYITNNSMQEFELFSGETPSICQEFTGNVQLRVLDDESSVSAFLEGLDTVNTNYPLKTKAYFINRYMRHPFYKYDLYGLDVSGAPATMLVCRAVSANGASAVRIVDLHGTVSKMSGAYGCFQRLLTQTGSEYMDLYCYGLEENHLTAAGFTRKTVENGVIVPNYYEPFVAGNVDILYAYHMDANRPYHIFKGDGDQDRPNQIAWEE